MLIGRFSMTKSIRPLQTSLSEQLGIIKFRLTNRFLNTLSPALNEKVNRLLMI